MMRVVIDTFPSEDDGAWMNDRPLSAKGLRMASMTLARSL